MSKSWIALVTVLSVLAISYFASADRFDRTDCSTIATPSVLNTVCFDHTSDQWEIWNGSAWTAIIGGGGGGGGAPATGEYITYATNSALSAERLITDSVTITWSTATADQIQAQRAALTGDVTASANGNVLTIANEAVTYAKIQNVATSVLLGRGDAGPGAPQEITIATNLTLTGTSLEATASSSPVGTVVDYAGSSAPSGWLFAFGQAISRTTYSDLFAVISTTYGVGDGSTTFNLPDLRGRIIAGRDDMGGAAASRITSGGSGIDGTGLGNAGGTQTHTLTTAEIAAHAHGTSVVQVSAGALASSGVGGVWTAGNTASAGGGSAHQNTQPTIILNKIIKF